TPRERDPDQPDRDLERPRQREPRTVEPEDQPVGHPREQPQDDPDAQFHGWIQSDAPTHHCRAIATRRRSSGEIRWSWSSLLASSCTQLIVPVNVLAAEV